MKEITTKCMNNNERTIGAIDTPHDFSRGECQFLPFLAKDLADGTMEK